MPTTAAPATTAPAASTTAPALIATPAPPAPAAGESFSSVFLGEMFFNVLVACIALGTGVDFAIHLGVRARREGGENPGEKAVDAEGASLSALIDSLEANHPGIKDRLVEDKGNGVELRRFVNVYINDEDVRFIGSLEAELSDGDQVVVLPAVAGGAC